MVEPGRSIVGPAGVLLTRVLYRKRNGAKEFVVVDAAMNDLIRPSLYRSHHEIVPVRRNALPPVIADVVGPVCETGDFLARDRKMANAMPGDFLAVCTAGAYGFVQSPITTRVPARPKCWWKARRGASFASANSIKTWCAANHSNSEPGYVCPILSAPMTWPPVMPRPALPFTSA